MPDDERPTDDDKVDVESDESDESDEVSGYGLSLSPGMTLKDPIDDWIEQSLKLKYARKDGSVDQGDDGPHHHHP